MYWIFKGRDEPMYINAATREISLKIVYYGPGRGGKTTNLEKIFENIPGKLKSDLVTVKTDEDRTIFFDFFQLEMPEIKGNIPKFNLYTVPGQVYYAKTRKVILENVDGVVFVADAHLAKCRENLESWRDLQDNLNSYGLDMEDVPHVVQFNKQDLPLKTSSAVLSRLLGIPENIPRFEASAIHTDGVSATLKAIINRVFENVKKELES